jgi:hypothetical protein
MTFTTEDPNYTKLCYFMMFQNEIDKITMIDWINDKDDIDINTYKDELFDFGVILFKFPWNLIKIFIDYDRDFNNHYHLFEKSKNSDKSSLLLLSDKDIIALRQMLIDIRISTINNNNDIDFISILSDTIIGIENIFSLKDEYNCIHPMYIFTQVIKNTINLEV